MKSNCLKNLLTICICIGSVVSASAQIEVTAHASVELPVDELKWVFKPGTGAVVTVSKTKRYKKKGSAMGVSLGYTKFTPKQDMFFYLVNADEVGTIKYDDMKSYQLSLQYRWDFGITKQVEAFGGLELGYHYTKFGFESHDPYQSIDSDSFVGRIALAPKIGIHYMFNKQIGAYLQTRYLISMAKSDIHDDQFNVYWTNSVGVSLSF
jgi:hypothetical protein